DDEAAMNQLIRVLHSTGLLDGVLFFYPRKSDDAVITTTASSIWPAGLNLRVVHPTDPAFLISGESEEPAHLVDE
ncbi:MAG TPA: hypothetical protein VGD38_05915, partial [Pyrinomonadaceae bacterium]